MGDIYALMIGINRYLDSRIPGLAGCVNDVRAATDWLEDRRLPGTGLHVKELLDHEATGAAIVEGIRHHLGLAGPGDVALLWFSGHGSTEPVGDFWYLEPNGKDLHTLVCADSRVDGHPELLDKELAVLLDELADHGCHVLAILDSCHAGGASRDAVTYRAADRASEEPRYRLLPNLAERYASGPPPVRHVLLAACRPEEKAGEGGPYGAVRGRFSQALLSAITEARAGATYRELVLLARNQVEHLTATQRPMVYPDGPGPADAPLFGGGAISGPPTFTMRHGSGGWQVNAGAAHGMAAGRTRFAVEGSAHEVKVVGVEAGRSFLAPVDWQPHPEQVYRLVLTHPAHPVLFGFDGNRFADAVRMAVGDDDPYIRIVDVDDAELILRRQPNGVRLDGADGERIATLATYPTVADLRHIARWWRVRTLRNDDSRIAHGVQLEMVEPLPDETTLSRQGIVSPPDADGTVRVAYEQVQGKPAPPGRFLRLRNTTNRPLYCVLLDLNERFGVDGVLYRTGRIEGGETAPVGDGQLIEFLVPNGWRNAEYRDWLMVIASTEEIDASPYEMPILDHSREALPRDIVPREWAVPDHGDWWTSVLPIIITGPS